MSYANAGPNKFHRLLFRWFRPQLVHLAYQEPKGKQKHEYASDRFEFCFYDTSGRAYYKVKEAADQPVVRKLFIACAYAQLISGIDDQDIRVSLEAIENAIHEKDGKGRMRPNIARIGFICKKLLNRTGTMIRMDLLRNLAATYFIREDEPLEYVDREILYDKMSTFRTGYDEQLRQFFFAQSLNKLFPFLEDPQFLEQAIKESQLEAMTYLEELNIYMHANDR